MLYTLVIANTDRKFLNEESLHTVDCIDLSDVKCDVQGTEKGMICSTYHDQAMLADVLKKKDSTNQRTEHFLTL